MRVLSVRPGKQAEDIELGRATLAAAIADPATTVMIIRGDGPEVMAFANLASGRAIPFRWRDVVWVADSRIFRAGEEGRLFPAGKPACAVVLDLRDEPVAWLAPDALKFDIEDAFLSAGGGEGHP